MLRSEVLSTAWVLVAATFALLVVLSAALALMGSTQPTSWLIWLLTAVCCLSIVASRALARAG